MKISTRKSRHRFLSLVLALLLGLTTFAIMPIPAFAAAPTVSATITDSGSTWADYTFTLDVAATIYYIVQPTANLAPSVATLKARPSDNYSAGTSTARFSSGLTPNTSYKLYFLASNSDGDSAVQSVSFTTAAAAAPIFTLNPSNRSVGAGGSVVLSCAANDAQTYQWQVSTDSGASWSDITNGGNYSSATGNNLGISNVPPSFNGYRYHCVATNGLGTATSSAATLTVTSLSSDASLISIAGQTITATGTGIAPGSARIASIIVPNATVSIATSDIVAVTGATVRMYSSFTSSPTVVSSVSLSAGSNHLYIWVQATDGSTIRYYDITVTRTPSAATPPAISQSSVDSSAVTGETSITLPTVAGAEYSRDGTNWQDSSTFAGLSPDTVYTFYIRTKGNEAYSPSASVVVTVRTKPGGDGNGTDNGGTNPDVKPGQTPTPGAVAVKLPKTKITKVVVGKRLAKITFKKVAKANKVTKYQLSYRVKGTKKWTAKNFTVKYTGKATAEVTVKKLKKGKQYQFRIRAWKTVSAKKYYAPWSAAKPGGKVK